MAELNFGLLTPPGSQSIGNAFVSGMDQAAAARQMENQNALSQYTLSKARREDEMQNQLYDAVRQPGFKLDIGTAMRYGAPGLAAFKAQQEGNKATVDIAYTQARTGAIPGEQAYKTAQTDKLSREAQVEKEKYAYEKLSQLALNPGGASDDDVRAAISDAVSSGNLSMASATRTQTALLNTPIEKRSENLALMAGNAGDRIRALMPDMQLVTKPDGSMGWVNKAPMSPGFGGNQGLPGYAAGMTPYQSGMLGVGQGNLGVNRAGLAIRAVGADPFNLSGLQDQYPPVGAGAAPRSNNLGTVPPVATPTAAPATPTGSTLGGGKLSLKEGIAQGLTGDALLATMPRNLAAQVTAITDHRAASPGRNTVRGDSLMQLVNMVDPAYDATQFKTKQGIETAFTSGRLGNTLRSLNVVQDHLGVFKDTAKALGNDNIQFTNAMGNQIARWTGEPAPTDFAAVRNVVADELTKAILGTAGALGDRTEMRNEVSAAASPEQLAGVVDKWQKLITGQVKGLQDQYTSGGGNNAAVKTLFTRAAAASAPTTASGGGAPTGRWGTAVVK